MQNYPRKRSIPDLVKTSQKCLKSNHWLSIDRYYLDDELCISEIWFDIDAQSLSLIQIRTSQMKLHSNLSIAHLSPASLTEVTWGYVRNKYKIILNDLFFSVWYLHFSLMWKYCQAVLKVFEYRDYKFNQNRLSYFRFL